MALEFQLQSCVPGDGQARLGVVKTPHGDIQTPVFMPVGTLASVKGVPPHVLENLHAEIVLANTYHLYLRPGHEQIRKLGGLHRFMSWDRPILTDSGGFQVFSLSNLRRVKEEGVTFRSHLDGSSHFFSPEHSMQVQIALGADIIMAFDECTEHPADRGRAQSSMEMTLRWARRSRDHFESHKHEHPWEPLLLPEQRSPPDAGPAGESGGTSGAQVAWANTARGLAPDGEAKTQSLFGIVQGGMYPDLRRESAERTVEIDFRGYAIGGLSVGEPRELTREMIAATLPHLPKERPRYVMGVGFPEEIVEYAAMGVDMMDCVIPTRTARHGLLFTSEGRVNIKNRRFALDQGPIDPECNCMTCSRYTRAYLRHLFVAGDPVAGLLNSIHNLAYYLDTMRSVRHAIKLGKLPELLSGVRSKYGSSQ